MDGRALLDGAALDDERARRRGCVLDDLVGVVGLVALFRLVGLGGAQLGLLPVEACQLNLQVCPRGVLPGCAERRLVDALVAEQLLDERAPGLDELQVVKFAQLGTQGAAELLVVLRATRQAREVGVDQDLGVEVGAWGAVSGEEGDQLVNADHDLLGNAEVGEAIVSVINTARRREVRLEATELDLERLVQEGAVIPGGHAQDVRVVRR